MNNLPANWGTATLADLCHRIVDGSHNPPKATVDGKPMLSARNIQQRCVKFDDYRLISDEAFDAEDRRTQVGVNDVLLTIVGTIGRVAVVQENTPVFALQRSVAVLKPNGAITPAYLGYVLESPRVQKHFIDNARGTAQKGIYLKALGEIELEVAPLNEQARIADKLDAVLARFDTCRDRLDRIPAILKRFRRSVLVAATSGKLTEDWRQGRGAGETWMETAVQSVAKVGTGSTPLRSNTSYFASSGTPWITSAATSLSVVFAAEEFVTDTAIAAHRLKLFPAGTLLVAMYGEGKTRGQVTELGIAATVNQACAAIVVDEGLAKKAFVKLALQANYYEMRELAEGGNQPNLNLSKIKEFPLLLPSLEEQTEIVRRVGSLFTFADRLEARYAAARAQVEELTPAILAKAFRGELVPQDPNDEPASVLLERIRARRGEPATDNAKRGRESPNAKKFEETSC